MANKALGRDLGDLLSRAQPARLLDRAAAKANLSASSAPVPESTEGSPPESTNGIAAPMLDRGADSGPSVLRPPPPPSQGFAMTSTSFAFFVADLLFLGLAVFLSRSGWFTFAAGLGLAVAAVLLGSICGCLGVLLMAAAASRGDGYQKGSKIRVQLKR